MNLNESIDGTPQIAENNTSNTKAASKLFQNITLESLLGGRTYRMIGDQMLFEKEGVYYLTTIDYKQNYTAIEYTQLPEGAPFQLVQGKLIFMPSPYVIHQRISIRLSSKLFNYVEEKELGEVHYAPLDVHFDEENVFQPDLLFVSVSRKDIIQNFIQGAPDLVVEILSKGTKKVDEEEKIKVYGKHNVLEYWLIHPVKKWVKVFENQSGEMVEKVALEEKGSFESKAVEGFVLDVEELFK